MQLCSKIEMRPSAGGADLHEGRDLASSTGPGNGDRSALWSGFNGKMAANVLHAFAHVAHSFSGLGRFFLGPAGPRPLSWISKVKPSASKRRRREASVARECLTTLVTASLAARKTLWRVSRKWRFWAVAALNVETVTQARHGQVFLGVFANIIDECRQACLVGRVDGPDNFVQGVGGFAGGLGNLAGVHLGFLRVVLVRFDHFAEQGQLSQAGADLVVNVARCGRVPFQRLLLALMAATWQCNFCVEMK